MRAGLGTISAPAGSLRPASGDGVLVAIRPEKLSISEQQPNGDGHAVEGVLDTAAYLGERSHYYVRIEGVEQRIAVSAQNAERVLGGISDEQRAIWLSWSGDAVILLNAD